MVSRRFGHSLNLVFIIAFCLALTIQLNSCTQHKEEPVVQKVDTSSTVTKTSSPKTTMDTIQNLFKASANVPVFHGRCVSISICGVDTRLNEGIRHADANHVIKFWLDSGAVEIVDIPRDTPVDAGLDSNLNILANLRAHRGRKVYMDSVAKMVGLKKIDYYCELGFSQAMGMLELLGHKDDAAQTLRVLRSRQGFDAGDFQRCYNQGTFMSQLLTRHFGKATGWFRDPLLRAGLMLVETDIPLDTIKTLVDKLEEKGFPSNKKCYVHIMPDLHYRLPSYEFCDADSIKALNSKIDQRLERAGVAIGVPTPDEYYHKLDSVVQRAAIDTVKHPRSSIAILNRAYSQRSWMQIRDKSKRSDMVKRICNVLISANNHAGKHDEARRVQEFYAEHKKAFELLD